MLVSTVKSGPTVSRPGGATPGQVYVYSREGFHWHPQQTLQSPTGAANSDFGSGVAISNYSIIVGAPGEGNNFDGFFTTAGGEAYVFRKSHGAWGETQEFRPASGGIAGFNGFGTLIVAGGTTPKFPPCEPQSPPRKPFFGDSSAFLRSAFTRRPAPDSIVAPPLQPPGEVRKT